MAILVTRDLDATRPRLTAWLARQLPPGAEPELSALTIPQGAGHSNETLLFDARWREGGAERHERFVGRVQPKGRAVFPEYDMALQFRCMELLGAHSTVPVPRVIWFEADPSVLGQPFYVMERVEGVVPSDNPPFSIAGWLAEATPAQQEQLWRESIAVLARIHRVDWRAVGFDFLDRPQYGQTGFDQQLGYYREFLPWATAGNPPAALTDARAWLDAHRPTVAGPTVLNWGDARISNMIYRDFAPVAVLDWEMACLGPGEVDLAWFLFMNHFLTEGLGIPNLPGFLDRSATAALYGSLAGRPVRDLAYYEVWAGFRFAAIMLAINQMLIEHGQPEGLGGAHELAINALAGVLARA
jgi:aminoglycoside phosphotransferase (APT) family kinase protein